MSSHHNLSSCSFVVFSISVSTAKHKSRNHIGNFLHVPARSCIMWKVVPFCRTKNQVSEVVYVPCFIRKRAYYLSCDLSGRLPRCVHQLCKICQKRKGAKPHHQDCRSFPVSDYVIEFLPRNNRVNVDVGVIYE